MFGPEYFTQVGWYIEGEMLAMDELEGLDDLTQQWDEMVEEQYDAHVAKGYMSYMFDRRRDIVNPDGSPITFDQFIEDATGARPLMEHELNEIEGEREYEARQQLTDAIEGVIKDTIGHVSGLVIERVKDLVDDFDADDLGVIEMSTLSGKPLR